MMAPAPIEAAVDPGKSSEPGVSSAEPGVHPATASVEPVAATVEPGMALTHPLISMASNMLLSSAALDRASANFAMSGESLWSGILGIRS